MSVDPLFQMTVDDLSQTASIENAKIHRGVFQPRPEPLPASSDEKEEECHTEKASVDSEGVGDSATFVLGSVTINTPLMARRKKRRDHAKRGQKDSSDRGVTWVMEESREPADEEAPITQAPEKEEDQLESLSRRLLHSPRNNDIEIEKQGELSVGAGGGESGNGRRRGHEGTGDIFKEHPLANESLRPNHAPNGKWEAKAQALKAGSKPPEDAVPENSALLSHPPSTQGSDLVLVGGLEWQQEARFQQAAPSGGVKYTPSKLSALSRDGDVTAAELRRHLLPLPAGQQPRHTSPSRLPNSRAWLSTRPADTGSSNLARRGNKAGHGFG